MKRSFQIKKEKSVLWDKGCDSKNLTEEENFIIAKWFMESWSDEDGNLRRISTGIQKEEEV